MRIKGYNCDVNAGEYEISLAKADIGITDVMLSCDYIKNDTGKYSISVYAGTSTAEKMEYIFSKEFNCEYCDLQTTVFDYIKKHIKQYNPKIIDVATELNKPVTIYDVLYTVYSLCRYDGTNFKINIYDDAAEICSNNGSVIETVEGRHSIAEIADYLDKYSIF